MPGIVLGLDIGTANVTISVPGRGVVLREPSVIAVDTNTDSMIACGSEAFEMLERTPDSIRAISPISQGVMSEYDYAEKMLCTFVRRVCAYKVLKPRAAAGISASATEMERRSAFEAVSAAGTRKVILAETSVAAAVGAGIDIAAPYGAMVVNIGAGTTNAAVLALGGAASSASARVGGNDMDIAIMRYMQLAHNHLIGKMTAEKIRRAAGLTGGGELIRIKGRSAISGLPSVLMLSADELSEAINEPLREIINVIQLALESTSPELAADVMEAGIVLTGGLTLMKGMPELIETYTGVAVRVPEHPMDCVSLGAARILRDMKPDEDLTGIYSQGGLHLPMPDSSKL